MPKKTSSKARAASQSTSAARSHVSEKARTSSKSPVTVAGPLSGKIALVTGASRGLGRAIALALAKAGARLIITGRDEVALASAGAEITALGAEVVTRHCDVRSIESVTALVSAVREHLGRIDVLINNAGIAHVMATIDRLSVPAWQEVIETNLTGAFLVTHCALPLMHPGATIVNNLSISAKTSFPGMAAYNASKRGLLAFTETLREELRTRGIRVIALIPGATDTDIWSQFWPDAPRSKMMVPESVASALVHALLLPENATVSELEITPTGGAL